MAVEIMNQQLHVKCRCNLLHILECSIHSKYGEHAKIKAAVRSEETTLVRKDVCNAFDAIGR